MFNRLRNVRLRYNTTNKNRNSNEAENAAAVNVEPQAQTVSEDDDSISEDQGIEYLDIDTLLENDDDNDNFTSEYDLS